MLNTRRAGLRGGAALQRVRQGRSYQGLSYAIWPSFIVRRQEVPVCCDDLDVVRVTQPLARAGGSGSIAPDGLETVCNWPSKADYELSRQGKVFKPSVGLLLRSVGAGVSN